MRRFVLLAAAAAATVAALAACASGDAGQPVATEADAIAVAKQRCAFTRPVLAQWHARLHDGQWHVWMVSDASQREPAVGMVDIWIGAKDGQSGDCNHA